MGATFVQAGICLKNNIFRAEAVYLSSVGD